VTLFRSLFRGRDEIFPTRFVSKKSGKAGYAPACRNKFVRGVCELPKVKCGECPNQAFIPFDDAAVVRHLTGRHVMGVYPLLDDETCWFLAVDFDKSEWIDDVGVLNPSLAAVPWPRRHFLMDVGGQTAGLKRGQIWVTVPLALRQERAADGRRRGSGAVLSACKSQPSRECRRSRRSFQNIRGSK
jgi:hypothetical protein